MPEAVVAEAAEPEEAEDEAELAGREEPAARGEAGAALGAAAPLVEVAAVGVRRLAAEADAAVPRPEAPAGAVAAEDALAAAICLTVGIVRYRILICSRE